MKHSIHYEMIVNITGILIRVPLDISSIINRFFDYAKSLSLFFLEQKSRTINVIVKNVFVLQVNQQINVFYGGLLLN
jgi:uncharacterized membrane protein